MGLKSVLKFVTWPLRFLWKHKNRFLPEKVRKMEKPTIVKEHAPSRDVPDIKSEPVSMPLSDNVVMHVKVDFSQNAPDQNSFYLNNGKVLRNLSELSEELSHIDQGTFQHHVNEARNDFSNWIRDIFKAPELASELAVVHDNYLAREILERHRL